MKLKKLTFALVFILISVSGMGQSSAFGEGLLSVNKTTQ